MRIKKNAFESYLKYFLVNIQDHKKAFMIGLEILKTKNKGGKNNNPKCLSFNLSEFLMLGSFIVQ